MKKIATLLAATALTVGFSSTALAIVSPDGGRSQQPTPTENAREYDDGSAFVAMADTAEQHKLYDRYDRSGR